jgi:hypothetical protein
MDLLQPPHSSQFSTFCPPDLFLVQEQSVGCHQEHHSPELTGDVEDLRPDERLSPRDYEEGHAQLVCLRDDASQVRGRQLVGGTAANGLRVAALASEVAAIGNAEYHDGRDGDSFARQPGPPARRRRLPDDGAAEEERPGRLPETYPHELREENSQAPVQERWAAADIHGYPPAARLVARLYTF